MMKKNRTTLNIVVALALGMGLTLGLLHLLTAGLSPVNAADLDQAASSLTISKTDGVEGVKPDDTLTYIITITNTAVETATGVVVTETLPSSTTFVGPERDWQRAGLTNVYTHAVGDLGGDSVYTAAMVLTVETPLPADVEVMTNTVEVTDDAGAYAQDTDVNVVEEEPPEPMPSGVITVCLGGGCDYEVIQDAVDAADEGDEIRVAAGTYTEISDRAGLAQIVYLNKSVSLRGGYTTIDWGESNPISNPTTLDAEGQGRVLYIAAGISPTIEGLRLTGGSALGLGGGPSGEDVGGGVYVGAGRATISGCQVMSNTALWGGGLYLVGSSARVLNNQIVGNESLRVDSVQTRGGGVYLREGDAVLQGNVVASNRPNWDWGGGVYLYRSEASLEANQVTDNVARTGGGGVHAWGGAPRLHDNLVSGNTAEWGGGLNLEGGSGDVIGNEVLSNTASYGGGGLCFSGGSASLTGNTVRANSAQYGGGVYLNGTAFDLRGNVLDANDASHSGGALFLYGAEATLTNNTLVDNRAAASGSGIQCWAGSMRLIHTTIARNDTQDGGGGIYLLGGASAALTNTILVGHSVGAYGNGDTAISLHATLWGSGAWANDSDWSGSGTIEHTADYWGDPAFVDPGAGDYRIGSSSAAIDRGVDAEVDSDIDGDPRPLPAGGGFDLGADEYAEIDLSASRKTVHPDQAVAGDVLTYTFLLLNEGNMQTSDTLLVDPVPTQTTYISDSETASAGLVTAGESIRWSGTLTPHQPVTVTFSVTLRQSSLVQNTAVVTDEKGGVTTLWALVNGHHCYLPLIAR